MMAAKMSALRRLITAPPDYTSPPPLLSLRSSKSFIVFTIFMMSFTDIFLYGLIVPVVPRALVTRVGLAPSDTQHWISILLAVYGGALLLFSPIFGYLADHTKSRRGPLVMGLLILAGATAMLVVGTSLGLWVAGRVLQGASCAMVWTVGLALLADTVEEDELGKYLGVVALAMTGGTLLGPLLGGIVYDHGGYYAVFGMAFGLIGVDVLLRLVMIERKIARKYWNGHDGPDYGTLTAQHSAHVGNESRPIGIHVAGNNGDIAQSEMKIPAVIWLLRSPRLLVALLTTMVFGVMLTAFDAVLPLFVQSTFGWSSSGSGLIFLPFFIPSLFGPYIGRLTDRYGTRIPTSVGLLFTVPFYVLLRLVTHNDLGQKILLCALMVLIGVGVALVSTPVFAEITLVVYEKEREMPGAFGPGGATAQAYGLFNMSFAAGTIVGPILAGFIKDTAGWATMSWCLAILTGLTSIPVFLVTGGWIAKRKGAMGDCESHQEDNK